MSLLTEPRTRGRPRHWLWDEFVPVGEVKASTRRRSAVCRHCNRTIEDARPEKFVSHLTESCPLAPPHLATTVAERHTAERAAMAAAGGGRRKREGGELAAKKARPPPPPPGAELAPITAGALDDMLLTWLASARVPLAAVDDPSFADFVYRLAPSYQPPSAAQLAMRQAALLSQSAAAVAAAAATAAVVAAQGGPPSTGDDDDAARGGAPPPAPPAPPPVREGAPIADAAAVVMAAAAAATAATAPHCAVGDAADDAADQEADVSALLDMVRAGGGGTLRSPQPPPAWGVAVGGEGKRGEGGPGAPPTPAADSGRVE